MMFLPLLEILAAIALDALLGDPKWLPHPVVAVGKLIAWLDKALRKHFRNLTVAGFLLVVIVAGITTATTWGLSRIHSIVRIILLYYALAPACLGREAMAVLRALKTGSVCEARRQIGMLVGRDTNELSEEQIVRATVETVAENTTDGVISPLFYMALGSLFGIAVPLVWLFKAVSTLDSMVGYRNEKYLRLGACSARLDDALNYIPARLTGLLMPVAALICGNSAKQSFQIMLRDHANHASPNSAWAEAAAAGALGIQLGGGAYYGGRWVEKKTIGDALRQPEPDDIRRTCALMYWSYAVAAVLLLGAVAVILWRKG